MTRFTPHQAEVLVANHRAVSVTEAPDAILPDIEGRQPFVPLSETLRHRFRVHLISSDVPQASASLRKRQLGSSTVAASPSSCCMLCYWSNMDVNSFAISTGWSAITKQEALDSEFDVLPKLTLVRDLDQFHQRLWSWRLEIEHTVARHLNVKPEEVALSEPCDWITGSFNTCLPIDIDSKSDSRLPSTILMRFVLPFAVGEDFSPGNVDEKVRCEAATYVWLGKKCSDIPLPRLFGFGFPDGQSVSFNLNNRSRMAS